jgi:hypothetical protein
MDTQILPQNHILHGHTYRISSNYTHIVDHLTIHPN